MNFGRKSHQKVIRTSHTFIITKFEVSNFAFTQNFLGQATEPSVPVKIIIKVCFDHNKLSTHLSYLKKLRFCRFSGPGY